jgi:TatD DNase family protein
MKLIDTHAHIDTDAFDEDRLDLIQRAKDNNLEYIIIPAISPKDFARVIEVTNLDNMIKCGMGVHPHNALEYNQQVEEDIVEFAKNYKSVVAIGEIGLDYYYDFAPKDVQKNVLISQLRIAKKLDLPVIIHNRESDQDLIEILEAEQDGTLKGVLHCFSSDLQMLDKAQNLGFHISYTGNITYKKSTLADIVAATANDRIMIETDSPFMSPVPMRGKRNEPANVLKVAEKISEIKNISLEEIIKMTNDNAKKLFKLMCFMLTFLALAQFAQAQDRDENGDLIEEQKIETIENPYKKGLGFGGFIGVNTIVETQYVTDTTLENGVLVPGKSGERPLSYEGLMSFGGSIHYGVLEYMWLEAAYFYSKNQKIADNAANANPPYYIQPNIHQGIELTALFTPNPTKRVNVFGSIGATYFMNSYNGVSSSKMGMNFSIGFLANLYHGDWGLITAQAQWRLNFSFGKETVQYQYRNLDATDKEHPYYLKNVEITSFFSIPRFGISFYPKF